jgi:hypothetical protein
MSIFSTFKGIIIVNSHWFRCAPASSSCSSILQIIILFYVYRYDKPLAYLSQIHYSIEGHYLLPPPPPPPLFFC